MGRKTSNLYACVHAKGMYVVMLYALVNITPFTINTNVLVINIKLWGVHRRHIYHAYYVICRPIFNTLPHHIKLKLKKSLHNNTITTTLFDAK
jgi:hypothetical protein